MGEGGPRARQVIDSHRSPDLEIAMMPNTEIVRVA